MSTFTPVSGSSSTGLRVGLAVGGILAALAGILILVWPVHTALVLTVIVAIYAITVGLVYAGTGIWSRGKTGWARAGYIVLGLVFVIAGVVALLNIRATTLVLATVLGILVAVMWIADGIVAFTTLRDAPNTAWAVVYAVLSLVAGFVLLFSPARGITLIYLLIGIALIVLGVAQVVRAIVRQAPSQRGTTQLSAE